MWVTYSFLFQDSRLNEAFIARLLNSNRTLNWFELVDAIDLPTLQRLATPIAEDYYDQNDGFGMALIAPFSFN